MKRIAGKGRRGGKESILGRRSLVDREKNALHREA